MSLKTVEQVKPGETFIVNATDNVHIKTRKVTDSGNIVCTNLDLGTISYFSPKAEVEVIEGYSGREMTVNYDEKGIGILIDGEEVISDLKLDEAHSLIISLIGMLRPVESMRTAHEERKKWDENY